MTAPQSFLRRLHGTLLSGLYRWPREHYQVFVARGDGPAAAIPSPAWTYFADPFVRVADGVTWLFVEEFSYPRNTARLAVLPLDADLQPAGPPRPLALASTAHASFPCVFAHDGAWWMIPETTADRRVDLYRALEFPHRWRRECTLLEGIDAADTVPLFHDHRWWLIAAVRRGPEDGGCRTLAAFHADHLLADAWTPHPVNRERRHGDSPFSWGRNAGDIIPGETLGWRPIQTSRHYYGESLGWMRLRELTPTLFLEEPGAGPAGLRPEVARGHHVSMHGGLVAWDVRDRCSYSSWLRRRKG